MAVVSLRLSFTDKCYKQVHKTFCECKRLKYLSQVPQRNRKNYKKYQLVQMIKNFICTPHDHMFLTLLNGTFPIAYVMHRMTLNDERYGKKHKWPKLSILNYCPTIFLERFRKNTKHLSQLVASWPRLKPSLSWMQYRNVNHWTPFRNDLIITAGVHESLNNFVSDLTICFLLGNKG